MTNITGEINLFVSLVNGYRFFSATIASKNEDGTYSNAYIDVKFAKTGNISRAQQDLLKLNVCYRIQLVEAFLGADSWIDNEGKKHCKPSIIIKDAHIVDKKQCIEKDIRATMEDLPF